MLSGLLMLTASCGSTLTDEEVLRANGVTTSGGDEGAVLPGAPDQTNSTVAAGAPLPSEQHSSSGSVAPAPTTSTGGQAAAVGTPGENGPIVIGSVGNYSGPAGAAQVGLPRGLQVWAASVNAKGGLFGRQVKVIVQDDGGDPARYAAAVQDLVENRGVIAFVAQGAVLSLRGGTKYLADKGIPVIGNDCAAPEWFASSTNYFPQCTDAFGQLTTYVYAGVQLSGKHRMGYVYCGETPACTSQAPILESPEIKRAGAERVYGAQISIAQIDFTSNCQAARSAGVEIMILLADPGTLSRFVRSCDRQGFTPTYIGLSIGVLSDTVKLPGLSRLILGVPTFPFAGASTPAIDEFRGAMQRYGNATPGPAESEGWVAAQLFQLAATKAAAATKSVNPKSLIAALRTLKGETLGGLTVPLDFTNPVPNNQRCAFIMQGDGKGGWGAPLGPGKVCIP